MVGTKLVVVDDGVKVITMVVAYASPYELMASETADRKYVSPVDLDAQPTYEAG
jgi:hypothetical protein